MRAEASPHVDVLEFEKGREVPRIAKKSVVKGSGSRTSTGKAEAKSRTVPMRPPRVISNSQLALFGASKNSEVLPYAGFGLLMMFSLGVPDLSGRKARSVTGCLQCRARHLEMASCDGLCRPIGHGRVFWPGCCLKHEAPKGIGRCPEASLTELRSLFFSKISAGSVGIIRSRDNHLLCERPASEGLSRPRLRHSGTVMF